jgi:hypothetical protein
LLLGLGLMLGGFACVSGMKEQPSVGEVPSYCSIAQSGIVKRSTPPLEPMYFFKAIGEHSILTFTAKDAERVQNVWYNLENEKFQPIPGSLDPVGLFGTPLLSVTSYNSNGSFGIQFYDFREFRDPKSTGNPILVEPPEPPRGRYQSLGILSRRGNRVTFRLVTDQNGGDYRDYEANFASIPLKLRPLSSVKAVCPNLRKNPKKPFRLHLPMISKDGKWFSAFDTTDQLMQIFELKPDGQCTPKSSPSLAPGDTGKLDFSATSDQVAYHFSDRSFRYSPGEFPAPEPSWQLRSLVYEFSSDTYRMLPFFGPDTNTYYPTFLPNGNIVVLATSPSTSAFYEVDPKLLKPISRKQLESYLKVRDQDFEPLQKLSQRWNENCQSDFVRSMRTVRMFQLMSLSFESCLELAAPLHLESLCQTLRGE